MPEMSSYPSGTFCWVDLATSDTAAAKTFYTELFGWTAADLPTDQGPPYTTLSKNGKLVCALFPLSLDIDNQPRWQAYISVDDVDAVADIAVVLGGRVIMPPTDVMQAGRMATILDPTGAAVCLWQPGEHAGAQLQNESGSQCWVELQTKDKENAAKFYSGLLGWTTRTNESVMDVPYEIFVKNDRDLGGMMEFQADWRPAPPNWKIYFGVEDCDATLARAVELGGIILFPVMEIESIGRFAFLQDPLGAVFAVIQPAQ